MVITECPGNPQGYEELFKKMEGFGFQTIEEFGELESIIISKFGIQGFDFLQSLYQNSDSVIFIKIRKYAIQIDWYFNRGNNEV